MSSGGNVNIGRIGVKERNRCTGLQHHNPVNTSWNKSVRDPDGVTLATKISIEGTEAVNCNDAIQMTLPDVLYLRGLHSSSLSL
jgi:hypothetical protein